MDELLRAIAGAQGLAAARQAANDLNLDTFEKGMLLYLNANFRLPEQPTNWSEAFGDWPIEDAMAIMRDLPPNESGAIFGDRFGNQQALRFPHLAKKKELN